MKLAALLTSEARNKIIQKYALSTATDPARAYVELLARQKGVTLDEAKDLILQNPKWLLDLYILS